jgi:hypothetical protein
MTIDDGQDLMDRQVRRQTTRAIAEDRMSQADGAAPRTFSLFLSRTHSHTDSAARSSQIGNELRAAAAAAEAPLPARPTPIHSLCMIYSERRFRV